MAKSLINKFGNIALAGIAALGSGAYSTSTSSARSATSNNIRSLPFSHYHKSNEPIENIYTQNNPGGLGPISRFRKELFLMKHDCQIVVNVDGEEITGRYNLNEQIKTKTIIPRFLIFVTVIFCQGFLIII